MTPQERHEALSAYGFTPRQAAFLTLVMLHAGVCLPRQYTTFAGIVFGQKTRDFFDRLVRERFATAYPCWRNAGRIFHLHHKGLYRAIGEPDNRHRRATTVPRAVERLMVLDAILADRASTWLATEREKVSHFVGHLELTATELPALTFTQHGTTTVRYFWHKLPVGIAAGDEVVLLYVLTEATGRDFRRFLAAHAVLLRRLRRWTVRLAVPEVMAGSQTVHRAVMNEFIGTPLRPAVVEEFGWFCDARRRLERAGSKGETVDVQRYAVARRAFGGPRFYAAYRTWCERGGSTLQDLLSPRLHDVWTRGDGRLEVSVLPHQYQHLAPAVATA